MATGFVSEIEIWEVVINGAPIARFVDEASADEYIRQIKEQSKANRFVAIYVNTIYKCSCSIARFVGNKEDDTNA